MSPWPRTERGTRGVPSKDLWNRCMLKPERQFDTSSCVLTVGWFGASFWHPLSLRVVICGVRGGGIREVQHAGSAPGGYSPSPVVAAPVGRARSQGCLRVAQPEVACVSQAGCKSPTRGQSCSGRKEHLECLPVSWCQACPPKTERSPQPLPLEVIVK